VVEYYKTNDDNNREFLDISTAIVAVLITIVGSYTQALLIAQRY
jgi:hypothetical protein